MLCAKARAQTSSSKIREGLRRRKGGGGWLKNANPNRV